MSQNSDAQKPNSSYSVLSWNDSNQACLISISSEAMSEYYPGELPDSSSTICIDGGRLKEIAKEALRAANDDYQETQKKRLPCCADYSPLTSDSRLLDYDVWCCKSNLFEKPL